MRIFLARGLAFEGRQQGVGGGNLVDIGDLAGRSVCAVAGVDQLNGTHGGGDADIASLIAASKHQKSYM